MAGRCCGACGRGGVVRVADAWPSTRMCASERGGMLPPAVHARDEEDRLARDRAGRQRLCRLLLLPARTRLTHDQIEAGREEKASGAWGLGSELPSSNQIN